MVVFGDIGHEQEIGMIKNATACSLFALLSVGCFNTEAAAVEPMSCMARYEAWASNKGPAPGTLATRKDTPCRLSRNITGKGAGTHQADGFYIVKAPKNGKIDLENASSFVFTPRNGFTGEDILVMRMKYVGGSGALVRFVISVD